MELLDIGHVLHTDKRLCDHRMFSKQCGSFSASSQIDDGQWQQSMALPVKSSLLQAFSPGLQVTERLKYSIEKEIRSQLAAKPRTSTWRLVATLIVIFIFVPLSALLAWDLRQQQLPAALPPPT